MCMCIPVLHYPVVLVVIGCPVARHQDAVVEVTGTAAAVGVHATGIELELVAGSIYRHTITELSQLSLIIYNTPALPPPPLSIDTPQLVAT